MTPVREGSADMTIAVLPAQKTAGGGHGLVVKLARLGVVSLTGFRPAQPLSGMRCISRPAFDAVQPLARGWGVETALIVDILRKGYRIEEVPTGFHHRVTGRRAQVHRARQFLVSRLRWPSGTSRSPATGKPQSCPRTDRPSHHRCPGGGAPGGTRVQADSGWLVIAFMRPASDAMGSDQGAGCRSPARGAGIRQGRRGPAYPMT